MIRAEVTGLRELGEKLRALDMDLRTGLLRASTGVAASSIRKEVESRAPVRAGTLKRAVYIARVTRQSNDYQQVFAVGVRKGKRYQKFELKFGKNKGQTVDMDAYYGRFLEFGTRNMQARPFMRPAFEAKKLDAISSFKTRMQKGLKRYGLQ